MAPRTSFRSRSAGRPENLMVILAKAPGSLDEGSGRNLPAVLSSGHCPPPSDGTDGRELAAALE
eukprot:10030113-Lingulodinium_polyedra.AAC.1